MSSRLGIAGIVLLAAFGLAACGGGGSTATAPPPPTPYQVAVAAIADADTAAAAQAAYDAVKGDVTAAQGEMLQAAVNARAMVLATMARRDAQKQAIMSAADMIDTSDLSTQAAVDAARTAIATLRGALDDAADVSDADKAMYMSQLDDAVMAVDTAQGGIDTATRRTNQMEMLSGASDTLQAALAALAGSTPTQAQLDAASNALAALNAAITGGADLTDTEKAPYQREAANAAAPIQTAQTAFNTAENKRTNDNNAAMAVTASKLYAGISMPTATDDDTADTDTATGTRFAQHAAADGDNAGDIEVAIGAAASAFLSEDKTAMIAANRGWTGKKYTHTVTAEGETKGDMYEAVVYSNVGEATEGEAFNETYTLNPADQDNPGELPITGTEATATARIASPSFDQDAGTKEFKLGSNLQRVVIPGSYHGVSGNYYCTAAADNTCAVAVADDGFTLGGTLDTTNAFTADGGTWTFKPTNAETKVTSEPDNSYASYGWWLRKSADGTTFTASAFVDERGTESAVASGLTALNGTAKYMGGAAGKYALRSSTGGTNDAGHFTARATLEADFTNNTGANAITGSIDNFMGADGMPRNWSVKLNGSPITDDGVIGNATATAGTEWTIGGTAANDAGQWSGTLRENGDDGVPAIATGTFYTTYGEAGRMVGAFGANKQ